MALTLDISPNLETLLRLQAAKRGQNITEYLLKLVEGDLSLNLSEFAGLEEFASSVAGIQAGLEDFEAGRTFSFEETFAKLEAEKAEWRKERKLKVQKHSSSLTPAL